MLSISNFSHSPDRAFVSVALNPKNIPIQFKIDTCSEVKLVNIISCKVLDKIKVQTPLEAPFCKVNSYSGEGNSYSDDAVKVIGKVSVSAA